VGSVPSTAGTTLKSGVDLKNGNRTMNILLIVVIIIAIILAITGGIVASIHWLLWVGIVVLVIAVIIWLVRVLTGRRRV
jgi:hypothetical protein